MTDDRFEKRLNLAPKPATRLYRLIAEIDAVKHQWHTTSKLSPQMVERLQTSVIVTSAGASTRIEGSRLSDAAVKDLYRNLKTARLKTRDEQEVGGYLDVLELIFEDPEAVLLTENSVLALHARVLEYSDKDMHHKGGYKTVANRVEARDINGELIGILFDPTPPHLVAKEMQELIAWTNAAFEEDAFPSLMVIANFLFEFLAIHPFQDGNGRLSRIITNMLLLQSGYTFIPFISHERIVEENKADYYVALGATQASWKSEDEDLAPWLEFFLKVVVEQARQALVLLEEGPSDLFLSEPQTEILKFACTQETFSRREVVAVLGLNQRTVDYSLRRLVAMNKLKRIGLGRGTRYRLA